MGVLDSEKNPNLERFFYEIFFKIFSIFGTRACFLCKKCMTAEKMTGSTAGK